MISNDWRYIGNGSLIPTEKGGYCDQPVIVRAQDGTWVCSVTTGCGGEGAKGQYVSIIRSNDKGKTWTTPVPLENTDWESAYSALAVAPSGRIYCFYCHNLNHVPVENTPLCRYDMGGFYCYRYSGDNGLTWSERHVIPVRDFRIDLTQDEPYREYEGKPLRFFWNVSRVFFEGDTCYSPLIKYHYNEKDILYHTEGTLLRAAHLDAHPDQADWETLPDGDVGLITPVGGGRVSEEQCYVRLSDGSIFAIYRTIDGFPACACSRDDGHTFEEPRYFTYRDGRPVKHNRAANFIWPLENNRFLYWFNNQGTKDFMPRNPVWCAIASEQDGPNGKTLTLSEPEILLYHESEQVGISYPSLVKDGGWYISETQKTEARCHQIDPVFLEKLCAGAENGLPVTEAPVLDAAGPVDWPELPLACRNDHVPDTHRALPWNGWTILFSLENAAAGETLFDTSSENGGLSLSLDQDGCFLLTLDGPMANCSLRGSAPLTEGKHELAVIIDPRVCVLYAVSDGHMDDGGSRFSCGWRHLNRALDKIPGSRAETGSGLRRIRLFDRPLLTSEAVRLTK